MTTKEIKCIGDSWEGECELISKYYCPYSAMAIMEEAVKKNYPDCPSCDNLYDNLYKD